MSIVLIDVLEVQTMSSEDLLLRVNFLNYKFGSS